MALRVGISLAAPGLVLSVAGAVCRLRQTRRHRPSHSATASHTRSLVTSFVAAFNAGDKRTLNRLWARRSDFRWYTAFQSEPPVAHTVFTRVRLMPYFTRRYRQGEQLRVVRFRFNGNGAGYGHFEYRIERMAPDLDPAQQLYDGEGAVVCFTKPRALAVWSMGTI